jgi:hypothetical protein
MPLYPIVLIHGYSDQATAFEPWKKILESRGFDVKNIHACSYRSLTNEVTIRDVAEGFDRALGMEAELDRDEPFDAIVHSTGMLVIRAWLSAYANRRDRLRHLIGLAPATFGSPLAHKGRSWLGALFKGNHHLGPDFLEAGDRILDGLEIGGRFTWDLAHQDILGPETFYGPTKRTPYVFIFAGNGTYAGVRKIVQDDATDGVVRWAGCALNTRKIVLDLTQDPSRGLGKRATVAPWKNIDAPLIFADGKNHSTILNDPGDQLSGMVESALSVNSAAAYADWYTSALKKNRPIVQRVDQWQQFIVRATDERGDPISDYNVQLFTRAKSGRESEIRQFDVDVHTYRGDASLRCFHVNLTKIGLDTLENLWIRVMASSGSQLVGYQGYGGSDASGDGDWDAELDISSLADDAGVKFFFPFTTTLIELRLNREPLPLTGKNEVCWF